MTSTVRNSGKTNGRSPAETVRPSTTVPPLSKERHGGTRGVPAADQTTGREVTTQAIAEAAYLLWQQRGGDEVVNWLEAEAVLKARSPRS